MRCLTVAAFAVAACSVEDLPNTPFDDVLRPPGHPMLVADQALLVAEAACAKAIECGWFDLSLDDCVGPRVESTCRVLDCTVTTDSGVVEQCIEYGLTLSCERLAELPVPEALCLGM